MWYSAVVLMKACFLEDSGLSRSAHLYEERVVVLDCADSDEAVTMAGQIGQALEHSYETEDGKVLRWSLDTVVSVCEISEPRHGSEVFHRYLSPEDAAAIQRKLE